MNLRRILIMAAVFLLLPLLFSQLVFAQDVDFYFPIVSSLSGLPNDSTLEGKVESGGTGLSGYDVTLLAIEAGSEDPAKVLGITVTNEDGEFEIFYHSPETPQDEEPPILFVKAQKDSSMLASAIGTAPYDDSVVINERTTVAAAFAFAQFIDGNSISGNTYGMLNAVHMAANLANPQTGAVSDVLGSAPNGPDTTTLATFNSLTNMVASCVDNWSGCYVLMSSTTLPGEDMTGDVLNAVANIAKYSWYNTDTLFLLSLDTIHYTPVRSVPPDAWNLFLRFTGTDSSEQTSDDLMNGPGAFAIDEKGFLWVNNNYIPKPPADIACAGLRLLKFYPWGESFPGSPYFGGGLEGAGFGIGLDPDGFVWVGNFGFQAPECANPGNSFGTPATNNSVSKFNPDGTAVSPDVTGYVDGDISWPQATVSGQDGNIWMANCGNDSVTLYPGGDHTMAMNISGFGVEKPFGIAVGNDDTAWIVGNQTNSVGVLESDGSHIKTIEGSGLLKDQLSHPMGIASDSKGNMWVANSDVVDAPCNPPANNFGDGQDPSIALITADGEFHANSPFNGGGALIPWGITVDGNDTVWVANFGVNPEYYNPDIEELGFPPRVSQFCGMDTAKCPPGKQEVGQAISPANGYSTNALMRNTGISIDLSGNVWLANNWKEIPAQINPGGNSIAVMIGAAAPIQTPLLGPPQSFDD